jgi:hypothetical protein
MRIDAMQRLEHPLCQRIDAAIASLRSGFRVRDRENFHHDRVAALELRLRDARAAIAQNAENCKRESEKLAAECAAEVRALEERHRIELEDFTGIWEGERTRRRFAKKSPALLNGLTIERKLALTGDFEAAESVRRRNLRLERDEVAGRASQMEGTFEVNRTMLLAEQDVEMRDLAKNHELKRGILRVRQAQGTEVVTNRQIAVNNMLQEEGDYARFMARKFKKPPGVVVPMSVALGPNADLPVPKLNTVSREAETMMHVRAASVATPLNLPPLKAKPVRKSKVGKGTSRRGD